MTDGDNLEELMKNASDCLASYVEGMKLQGKPLPVPLRINITSTEAKIAEVTTFARKVSKTRSELMVDATLEYIRAQI